MFLFLLLVSVAAKGSNPVSNMLVRLQKGLSARFKVEIESSAVQEDYFELSGGGSKVTCIININ